MNFPVTKIEAEDALYASTAHTVGTTLLGQKANGATGQLDVTYNKFSGSSLWASSPSPSRVVSVTVFRIHWPPLPPV